MKSETATERGRVRGLAKTRKQATSVATMLVAGCLALLPSCAGTPTPTDIDTSHDRDAKDLERHRDEMIARCNGDADCIRKAEAWFRAELAKVNEARRSAKQHNWQDAYERRKLWEDSLRGLIPAWPSLKDLFFTPGVVGSVQIESGSLGSTGNGSTTVSWEPTVKINGTASFGGSISVASTVEGNLQLSGTTAPDGTRSARVYSGTIIAKVGSLTNPDAMATLTVAIDERNRLEIAPNGTGTLTVVVTRELSDKAWNALVPYYIMIRLPVTLGANDSFSISQVNETLAKLTGRTPFPITDYDGDGIRNHDLDHAALLVDFALQEERADINVDGLWDQVDLDTWERLFTVDFNAQ